MSVLHLNMEICIKTSGVFIMVYKIKCSSNQNKFLLLCLFVIQKLKKHGTNKEMQAGSIKEMYHNCTAHRDSSCDTCLHM